MSSPRAGERARRKTYRPRTTSRRYVWVFFEHPTRAVRPRYAVSTRTRPHAQPSPDARLTATLRFPPRDGRHIPQAFSPLNFGDLDVEQQADTLFSKVRLSLRLRLLAIAPNAAATDARASARRLVFGKREHTSLRVFVDRRKHAPLTPFSSTPRAPRSSATRNRDRCARSPRARSRRFSMNPTSARTRYVPAPRTSRDTPRTPVSSFETNPSRSPPNLGTRKTRVASRRRRTPPNPSATRGAFPFRFRTLFRFSDTFRFGEEAFSRARGDALDRSFPRSFPRSVCCAPLRLETPRIVIDHARELTITRAPERRARRNGRRSRICRRCRAT